MSQSAPRPSPLGNSELTDTEELTLACLKQRFCDAFRPDEEELSGAIFEYFPALYCLLHSYSEGNLLKNQLFTLARTIVQNLKHRTVKPLRINGLDLIAWSVITQHLLGLTAEDVRTCAHCITSIQAIGDMYCDRTKIDMKYELESMIRPLSKTVQRFPGGKGSRIYPRPYLEISPRPKQPRSNQARQQNTSKSSSLLKQIFKPKAGSDNTNT
ncbi:hypothetical protein BDN71DRAFT_1514727 [Pleurotus eryngii]|uniref:Uncharacterized protein n=1 Tax=Pleurotus eryngii TaxID=5323 RepID=A0A9P6D8I3_PLEER|nr:hypothetical protein BDN71DRAFT_1514727 [Pleurotus eryngii]